MSDCQKCRHSVPAKYMCWNIVFGLFLITLCAPLVEGATEEDGRQQREIFAVKILPLLQSRCFGCHGGSDEVKGDLVLTSREDLLHGGESGEAGIVPGKPHEGTLLAAIRWDGYEMPPKESERLTAEEVRLVEEWIAAGAPWPEEVEVQAIRRRVAAQGRGGIQVQTSGGTSEEWTSRLYDPDSLWAFQSVRPLRELLPETISQAEAIDYFIDKGLEAAGLRGSPEATPQELVRRVTYDLTGLPPTSEETANFIAGYAVAPEETYRGLVDRLLESPRYGEHWARHWLDVTRYSDTGGMSNDYERSNMWRYRDYVIRAFNNDKPYDEFVREQVAGDELAEASARNRLVSQGLEGKSLDEALQKLEATGQYTDQEVEWLVASGFLRLGPYDNAMVEPEEARQIYLDDLVNITGQTFLSQTLRCCKCHDHKFDPIPTRDYYRLYAAFATTFPAERPARFLATESKERFDSGRMLTEKMLQYAKEETAKLVSKREQAARQWYAEHDLPYKDENARKNDPDEEKPPRHVGLDHVESGQLKVREQDVWIWQRRLERYQPMVQSVFTEADHPKKFTGARKLRISRDKNHKGEGVKNFILAGGSLAAPTDTVKPGVISAVSLATNLKGEDPHLLTDSPSGRRTQLADWIANASNPLTTRSIVNRIWQYHFGKGLAANPNNFGGKGGHPTHPELLDYLANQLVKGGWRIKQLHREIVCSKAYRRSTVPRDAKELAERDPGNELLSVFRRRRLSAEEIRDSLLSVTGELMPCEGGLPVFPEINMEVALQPRMIQFSLAPAYQPSQTPEERNKRTIFAYHCRGQADPFLELFNQPNPNESCELRDSASVTPQAFTLLNSQFMVDRSVALAVQIASEHKGPKDQVVAALRRVLNRDPNMAEIARLEKLLVDMSKKSFVGSAYNYPSQITRSLVEEFSGEPFEYVEILPVFEQYQPDPKIESLSPAEQGLAEVCLLLMNANEFMYVN